MQEALQKRVMLPAELESAVWDYYRKTSPSLQEFYSRYTPEWEHLYDAELLPTSDFLPFHLQTQPAFPNRYVLTILTVPY